MFIDNHCDALYKLFTYPELQFQQSQESCQRENVVVNLPRLKQADVRLQCFAIYISEQVRHPSILHVLSYIQLFQKQILSHPDMMAVRTSEELESTIAQNKTGAMLTLEGVDALQGQVEDVDLLFHMGVRCIGITWNYANWAADGVLEPRQAGFTRKGRELIKRCNQLGILLDCSHLNETAFWELCERTQKPFFASHSNVYAVCPHPRNLHDAQIEAIIQNEGIIGLTFVPSFLHPSGSASRDDLIKHIDHAAALGAGEYLCFGSDFDGTDECVQGLEHTGKLVDMKEWLLRYYTNDFVEGLMWKNAYRFYHSHLPKSV